MSEATGAQKAPPPKTVTFSIPFNTPYFSEEHLDGLTEFTIEINTEVLRNTFPGAYPRVLVTETVREVRSRV